jgi:hypothetical protein
MDGLSALVEEGISLRRKIQAQLDAYYDVSCSFSLIWCQLTMRSKRLYGQHELIIVKTFKTKTEITGSRSTNYINGMVFR